MVPVQSPAPVSAGSQLAGVRKVVFLKPHPSVTSGPALYMRLLSLPAPMLAPPRPRPLVLLQVEDGGKASLSQKMRPGDELVNINGTPLYGSRQEALILIKGSYRTLKMIIRR